MSIPHIKVRWAHGFTVSTSTAPPLHLHDPTTGSQHCQCQVLGTSAHAVAVILSQDKPWLVTSRHITAGDLQIRVGALNSLTKDFQPKQRAKGLSVSPTFSQRKNMGWVMNSHGISPTFKNPKVYTKSPHMWWCHWVLQGQVGSPGAPTRQWSSNHFPPKEVMISTHLHHEFGLARSKGWLKGWVP